MWVLHTHADVGQTVWTQKPFLLTNLPRFGLNFFLFCVCVSAGNAVKKKQSRKRLIIQMPPNGGQECPEVLEEERDCEAPRSCPGFR